MRTNTPFSPGTRVVAYLRDSGGEDQELSVDQQENSIRSWCADNSLALTRVYTDAAAPGSSTVGRAAFQAMISHFHDPDCADRGVVIWKYNRFARDIDDAQFYKADLRRRGYVIHSLNDSIPDGLDGRFMEAAIDWMNTRYLEDLRADIIRGQHHLVEQYGALGGTPPRGFMRQPVQIGLRRDGRPHLVHRWVPDPEWIDRIRLAWAMRAEGKSYREINNLTRIYKSTAQYRAFFENQLYIGRLIFAERVIENYCDPIVDPDTWKAVQKMNTHNSQFEHLSGDNPNHPRRAASSFILSGLVRCAECGSLMDGEVTTGKGKRYGYYRCADQHRTGECKAAKIPKWALEAAVIQNLVDHILQEDNLKMLLANYENDQDQVRNQLKTQRDILAGELLTTKRKINNLAEVLSEDGLKSRALVEKMRQLEKDELRLIGEIEGLRDPENESPAPTITATVQSGQTMIDQLLASHDDAETKRVMAGLIDHIDAKKDGKKLIRGVIYYFFPSSGATAAKFMPTVECPRRESNPQPRR